MFRRFTARGRQDAARASALSALSAVESSRGASSVLAGPEGVALRAYLSAPPPDPSTPVLGLRLLAVDIETTGLDPRRDHVLSIGFVPVDGLVIDLSGAFHEVIRSDVSVGQSATVHGLTDDRLAAGAELSSVLPALLTALTGRVLLAHFSVIEEGFLGQACLARYGVPLPLSSVDTLELHRRIITSPSGAPSAGALRLPAARDHFHLPRYRGHEALTDALACAELYLAQASYLSRNGEVTLKTLQR